MLSTIKKKICSNDKVGTLRYNNKITIANLYAIALKIFSDEGGKNFHQLALIGAITMFEDIENVLNCSFLAMVEEKKYIEKSKNLVYNRLCNQKLQKYCIGGFLDDKRRVVEEDEGRYENEKFFALLI